MNTQNDVNTQEAVWVPISQITVPGDVRPHSAEDVASRAVSMDRDGQEQNALLSKEGDRLVLVYGHGRYLSAQKLGWEKLRCDVKEGLTESQKLMLALAENAERENESPFHTASTYGRIKEVEHLEDIAALAQYLAKDRSVVSRYLGLNAVSKEVCQSVHACTLGLRQCLEIAKLTKVEDQLKVMEECATQDLAGKALEARVKQLLNPAKAEADGKEPKAIQTPAFQFRWKGRELIVKARPFCPDKERWNDYSLALDDASSKYRMAFPLPELNQGEVAKAA